MKSKAIVVVLVGAVALWLYGCGKQQPGTGGKKETTTSKAPVEKKGTAQPAPEGQGGTAGVTAPGGVPQAAQGMVAQAQNEYVKGAELILNGIQEKLTAIQQQASAQGQEGQKVQELAKQVQTQLADAKAALDKVKTATATQLADAKVAADTAIKNVQESFKNLQSQAGTQVTQAQ